MKYFVYILRCADGTFYTGMTSDLKKRVERHNAGRGAKYTRGRRPVVLAYACQCEDMKQAMRLERQIKRCDRAVKENMCDRWTRAKRVFQEQVKNRIEYQI